MDAIEIRGQVTPATDPNASTPSLPDDAVVQTGTGGVQVVDPSKAPTPEAPKSAPERPSWLPEGFETPEDLAKAYAALKAPPEPAVAPEATPETAARAVDDAGLDLSTLSAEIATKGTLSEETLKVLDGKGIKPALVEQFIAGQKALGEKLVADLAATVGGKESLDRMLAWAAKALPADEVAAFNAVIDSGNAVGAKLALRGLQATYTNAVGSDPSLVSGESGGRGPAVQPFGSRAEMVKAMQDPRYERDSAYRAKVERRVGITDVFALYS